MTINLNLVEFLWSITERKKLVFAVFGLTLLTALLEGIGLALLYPLFDSVVGGEVDLGGFWERLRNFVKYFTGSSGVKGYLIILLIIFLFKSIFVVAQNGATTYLETLLQQDWTLKLYDHYLRTPYQYVANEPRGKTIQNIFGVSKNLSSGVMLCISIITALLFCITLVAALFALNWKATLVVLTTFSIGALLVKVFLFDKITRKSRKLISVNKQMKSLIIESILSLTIIRLFEAENIYIANMKRRLKKILKTNVFLSIITAIPTNFGEFFVIASVAAAFIMFNVLFDMSFRDAAPLIGAFAIIATRAYGRLNTVMKHRLKLEALRPWFDDARVLFQESYTLPSPDKGIELDRIKDSIKFIDVSFSNGGNCILKGVTVEFPPRKMIGIVGPSGIGKTTLSHMLTRLYEPSSGKILIGDTNINDFTLRSMRKKIGYVPQDPVILNTTIFENIRLGEPEATDEDIFKASRLSGAHEFILSLENGYETLAGEQGNRLSGGERQRIAIARAIVRKPDVLILDESTSALDPPSAELIRQTVERISRTTTVIIIAHRISILKNADIIYEFTSSGRVRTRTFNQISKIPEPIA